MTPEELRKIEEIFQSAIQVSPETRSNFVKQACGDDIELRQQVERLLQSYEESQFMDEISVEKLMEKFVNDETFRQSKVTETLPFQTITSEMNELRLVSGEILSGRYRIVGLIGKGGMGEVYKAEDVKLSQMVALKFLPESLKNNKTALKQLHDEVRLARQVSHPNICRVFDIGEVQGHHFLSMEYIEGDDLSSLLRRVGRLPAERAIEIGRQLCIGLSAIHNAGILHRDFKPANIIIDSAGKVRITDFGIAGVETEIDDGALRVGTPAYMSPEQIDGKNVSTKSDIYALGLVLYEIFTGRQAFQADSIAELAKKQKMDNPSNPSEFIKDISPIVEEIIFRCIEKNPEKRPDSALEVGMLLPGTDPLKIALDSGQTPTPEMLATVSKKGALKLKTALIFLICFIAVIILATGLKSNFKTYKYIPLQKNSDILTEKSKSVIQNLGYSSKNTDSYSVFNFNTDFEMYSIENGQTAELKDRLGSGQPYIIYFLYRQSPVPLLPWVTGWGAANDPPLTNPGMINVSLDTTGRLVEFIAVPDQKLKQSAEELPFDWAKIFTEAGLDINKFENIESELPSPVVYDSKSAWKGALTDFEDIPIKVETASFQGKPVHFKILYPWTKSEEISNLKYYDDKGFDFSWILMVLLLFVVVGAVFLIRRNLKYNQADIKGSVRLGFILFLLSFIHLALQSNHFSTFFEEMQIIGKITTESLYFGVQNGLFYCAFEPYLRRWWPELLISWSRLLGGDYKNPLIGRDILIGGLFGTCTILFSVINNYGAEQFFGAQRSVNSVFSWQGSGGIELVFSKFPQLISMGIYFGFIFLIFLLVTYFIFRRKKICIGLLCLILIPLSLPMPGEHPIMLLTTVFSIAAGVFVLFRFGLVAYISFHFYAAMTELMPTVWDKSNILFIGTILNISLLILIAIIAFRFSIGGKNIFGNSFLPDTNMK